METKSDSSTDVVELLKAATAAHKIAKLGAAEALYRKVLSITAHPSPEILLASVLLSTSYDKSDVLAARKQALSLANHAVALLDINNAVAITIGGVSPVDGGASATAPVQLKPREKVLLHTRYGYFLLQYAGYVKLEGRTTEEPPDLSPAQRKDVLALAIKHLEVAAGPATADQSPEAAKPDQLVWRNLSLAYTACERLNDAERACGMCVLAAGGKAAPWDLHYKHGKALKRLGKEAEALDKYCDAVEASKGHEMPLFWLRVADVGGVKVKMPASLVARVKTMLQQYGGASASSEKAAGASKAVPDEYIRKLFDGYSKHFDEHLVQGLGYATPTKLLRLLVDTVDKRAAAGAGNDTAPALSKAVHAALEGKSGSGPVWSRCADLGCGTGLAGVAFRPLVGHLAGVDLSPGMVAEARRRTRGSSGPGSSGAVSGAGGASPEAPLYDLLEAGEIAAWLDGIVAAHQGQGSSQAQAGSVGPVYDLLLAADVLVYIGDLSSVFTSAARAMAGGAGTDAQESAAAAGATPTAPRYFVFSTESLEASLGPDAPSAKEGTGPGFALTGTGRCVHARWYITSLAAAHGFTVAAVQREVIRQNAGKDVLGDLYVLEYVWR